MITVLMGFAAVLILAYFSLALPVARAIKQRQRTYYAKHVLAPQLRRIWKMYPPQRPQPQALRCAA